MMVDLIKQITSDLQKQIDSHQPGISVIDFGTVLEAGDGIERIAGLANVKSQEPVQFQNGVMGIASAPNEALEARTSSEVVP
jgi:F-type H+-transporting ATPase subunit alpha